MSLQTILSPVYDPINQQLDANGAPKKMVAYDGLVVFGMAWYYLNQAGDKNAVINASIISVAHWVTHDFITYRRDEVCGGIA